MDRVASEFQKYQSNSGIWLVTFRNTTGHEDAVVALNRGFGDEVVKIKE